MTVKELINKLKNFPEEAIVIYYDTEDGKSQIFTAILNDKETEIVLT